MIDHSFAEQSGQPAQPGEPNRMDERKLYVLVHEVIGSFWVEREQPSTCVSLQCSDKVVYSNHQISTFMPLWNEILEIPVPELPTIATFKLLRCLQDGQFQPLFEFEISVTAELVQTFYDERLLPKNQDFSVIASEHKKFSDFNRPTKPCRLHVACSLNREYIECCRRGLWPIQSIPVGQNNCYITLATRATPNPSSKISVEQIELFDGSPTSHQPADDADQGPLNISTSPISAQARAPCQRGLRRPPAHWHQHQQSFSMLSGFHSDDQSPIAAAPPVDTVDASSGCHSHDDAAPRRSVSPTLGRVLFREAGDRSTGGSGSGSGGGEGGVDDLDAFPGDGEACEGARSEVCCRPTPRQPMLSPP